MPAEKLLFSFGVYEGATDPETGLRHGEGILRYNNGNVYEGAWVQGAATGMGKKRWANGDSYEGSFVSGKKHGEGQYCFANGAVYRGQYVDDFPCGNGTQLMPNGDVYEGEWSNGRRHGKGVETLHDGQCFTGSFVMGKKNGRGTLRAADGTTVVGLWEGDRCVEIISREGPSREQVEGAVTAPRPPLPMEEMLAEMEAAGLDRALLDQISHFNTNVLGQMDRVMGGLGSLDHHLNDLRECLNDLDDLGVVRNTSNGHE